ncbi:MAG: hypothetical protein ACLFRB_07425 [Thiohalorhabdus sp.]|uniref:hypothetical protein n=1 Tax=Thiohalorhabdus sp. TaxID=3094134 RepID=UPI0039804F55
MSEILEGLKPLRVRPKRIDAECYNRIRVRLMRTRRLPVRVAVPGHPGLEMILTDDAWLGVDAHRNDLPIIAWSRFEAKARTGLREPVPCRLSLYHTHAGLIMGSVLEALAGGEWENVEP